MKQGNRFTERLEEFHKTLKRFPLTGLFLFALAIINAILINNHRTTFLEHLLVALLIGTGAATVFQVIYERFFTRLLIRWSFMAASVAISGLYLVVINIYGLGTEAQIRTAVILFICLIAFLWIPTVNNRISFNESFMALFKAFFIAIFFTGVLFLGCSLILAATNMLIISIDSNAYTHSANIIFVLLAPIFFLTLIPVYPGYEEGNVIHKKREEAENSKMDDTDSENSKADMEKEAKEAILQKSITPTKFIESLISYIVVPITAVYTIILLLYIIINVTGEFWKDNLMEPLLVAYSIIVIVVYLLASRMENAFAHYFRKIFPKVLIPVVLFQTVSSIIKIGDLGITNGRYYVILFGAFATFAGILFCIKPVHKNGILAPVLILLSILSILPPVDAFTVSRVNQTSRLENTLKKNQMLEGNRIHANTAVSEKDRKVIVQALNYLEQTDDIGNIAWLEDYDRSKDFTKTFGFERYSSVSVNYDNRSYYRDTNLPVPITGYDYMIRTNVGNIKMNRNICSFVKNSNTYQLEYVANSDEQSDIVLKSAEGTEILRFKVQSIFDKVEKLNAVSGMLSQDEATISQENDLAAITFIIENININEWDSGKNKYADVNILIRIK